MTCTTDETPTFRRLTPLGPAGIAAVRLTGRDVGDFLERHIRSRTAPSTWRVGDVWRVRLLDHDGEALDDCVLLVVRAAPRWDVQLHLHGSPAIVRHCATLAAAAGFLECDDTDSSLWAAPDALTAEAWAAAPLVLTAAGLHWLLRQPSALRAELTAARSPRAISDVAAALLRRPPMLEWFTTPLRVALLGPPNDGKSTLLNALADRGLSIVSPTPGATRDWVTGISEFVGLPIEWIDTAGMRPARDALEAAGIARSTRIAATADVLVLVLDPTEPGVSDSADFLKALPAAAVQRTATVVALSKSDLPPAPEHLSQLAEAAEPMGLDIRGAIRVAGQRGEGLEALAEAVLKAVGRACQTATGPPTAPTPFTDRQRRLFRRLASEPEPAPVAKTLESLFGGHA